MKPETSVPNSDRDPLSFLEDAERSLAPKGIRDELLKGVGLEIRNMLGATALEMIPFGTAIGFIIKAQGIYRAARERALAKINELRLTEYVVTGMRTARAIEDRGYKVTQEMKPDITLLARRKKEAASGSVQSGGEVQPATQEEITILQEAAKRFEELELQLEILEKELKSEPENKTKLGEAMKVLCRQRDSLVEGVLPSVAVTDVSERVAGEASHLLHATGQTELSAQMREALMEYNTRLGKRYDDYRHSALNVVQIFHSSILHCLPDTRIQIKTVNKGGRSSQLHWVENAVIPINPQMRVEMKKCAFNDFGGWKQGTILIFSHPEDKEPTYTFDSGYAGDYVVSIKIRDNAAATLYDNEANTLKFSDRIREIGLQIAEACARMGGGPKERE